MTNQQIRDVDRMPAECWYIVCDAGPQLNHHLVNLFCFLSRITWYYNSAAVQTYLLTLQVSRYCSLAFQIRYLMAMSDCTSYLIGHRHVGGGGGGGGCRSWNFKNSLPLKVLDYHRAHARFLTDAQRHSALRTQNAVAVSLKKTVTGLSMAAWLNIYY